MRRLAKLKIIKRLTFLFILMVPGLIAPSHLNAQSHNYWTRSFNEESSLLSGAVVGGGSGPSAIYYNPASISEVKTSKLSINASLFSFIIINVKNAMGDGINLNSTRFAIEPRFVSYMLKWKKHPSWSFEAVYLNNENTKTFLDNYVDEEIDILPTIPGMERYFGVVQYVDNFRDDWLGLGGSIQVGDRLFLGASMFVAIKSITYTSNTNIYAYSLDDSISIQYAPYSSTSFQVHKYLKMNDYRLLWKGGLLYKGESFSIGLSIMTPSLGGIYSDGKRVNVTQSQNNIIDPESGETVPNYSVADYEEKKDMTVAYKTPWSIAAGFTYYMPSRGRTFYTSVEYFFGIDPYRLEYANEDPDLVSGIYTGAIPYNEWLTFVTGARPVFNFAFGYSWTLKKDLLLMGGFRTDFNYQKGLNFGDLSDYNRIMNLNLDLYYITCGLSWDIRGQNFITGLQYTVGRTANQTQIINMSDPVEYNSLGQPLQGIRTNDMISLNNAISLYFGASFNFGGNGN